MFIMLDMLIIIIMIIMVLMVYSGFMSLLDSKVMAMTQNRMGPALFLFGMCTPMFDGVKLMLKFGLLILNVEILYLFMITVYSLMFNYSIFLMMPMCNMLLMNMQFNNFMLMSLHTMLFMVNTFLVGCFMMNTCFVYLATMRSMLCSLMAEFCMIIIFMYTMNINFYAMSNFNVLNVYNMLMCNFMMLPMFIVLLVIMCMYLQNMMNIFEFAEAESELVAGTITEFSGMFFCMSSLMEIAHVMLSTYLVIMMLIGGLYFNMKCVLCMMMVFLIPKLLLCSLKINNAILFLFLYMFNYLFMYFMFLNIMKLLYMNIM